MSPIQAMHDLLHLDMDAIKAYEQASKSCDHASVAQQLRSFQGDHQRHVRDLSAELTRLGEKADVRTDVKGFFIEAFTAITSIGTHSALVAMKGNEQLTTSKYKAALELRDLPQQALDVIRANYADEQRHLAWIKDALDRKVWESEPASPHP